MISVNQGAMKIVNRVLENAEELNVTVQKLKNGTTVIDMGQEAKGSWLAGKYYAEITMGGLGDVSFDTFALGDIILPAVCVSTSQPMLAGWVSQKHAEPIPGAEKQPILAGPAKALLQPPDESIEYAQYKDPGDVAVAPFQTSDPFTEETAKWIADSCRIKPKNLFVVLAPTNSLVAAIQVPARPIDNITHRLHAQGFDIRNIHYAMSKAPIAPLAKDEQEAMGRINDSMIYGAWVYVSLEGEDSQIEKMLPFLPSRASKEYGKPFKQIFEEHDCDFHKIDLSIHSLAKIQINNITSGRTFTVGEIDFEMLKKSFL